MIKRIFKRNTHNAFFRALAGFGRSMNRLYENRNHDIHSNGELALLRKISTLAPSVIIDGGANIGEYSLRVARLCRDCKIYAFEPVKTTFDIMKTKVGSINNIIPVNQGLFSESCIRKINLYTSHTHSSLYNIRGLKNKVLATADIELIKGDDYIMNNHIDRVDFLKLDLEGSEYDALLGFQKAIGDGRIRLIQFEYGYINITTKRLLVDYYAFFNEYGYVIGKVFPKSVEFREYMFKYEDFLGPNYVAVRKSDTGLISLLEKR